MEASLHSYRRRNTSGEPLKNTNNNVAGPDYSFAEKIEQVYLTFEKRSRTLSVRDWAIEKDTMNALKELLSDMTHSLDRTERRIGRTCGKALMRIELRINPDYVEPYQHQICYQDL